MQVGKCLDWVFANNSVQHAHDVWLWACGSVHPHWKQKHNKEWNTLCYCCNTTCTFTRHFVNRGRWERSVYATTMSTTCRPQPALVRGVTHTPLACSPTACQWHGKVCLTKLLLTHFLSRPCTCTPLGDVIAGFPLGAAQQSTRPIWHDVHMRACMFICTSISTALLGQFNCSIFSPC